jgi:hypothetical protein
MDQHMPAGFPVSPATESSTESTLICSRKLIRWTVSYLPGHLTLQITFAGQ